MTRRAPSYTLACLFALAAGGKASAYGPDHDPAPTPAPKPAPAPAPTQFDNGVPVPVAGREPDSDAPPGGGPGGLRVTVRNLAAATTTIANPPAPLGSFDTGAGALQPGPARLCSLAAPVW